VNVSILVFLDQALKDTPIIRIKISGSVSILVFLDQALKADQGVDPMAKIVMFQSLFSWIKR